MPLILPRATDETIEKIITSSVITILFSSIFATKAGYEEKIPILLPLPRFSLILLFLTICSTYGAITSTLSLKPNTIAGSSYSPLLLKVGFTITSISLTDNVFKSIAEAIYPSSEG